MPIADPIALPGRNRLKKVSEQVIVITGASSGIGLCTAKMAAERGARLVLCSRNFREIQKLADEIERRGGSAIAVAGDVADPEAMEEVAQAAIRRFGHFDTWINNAATTIYGELTQIHLKEKRRLFDVNFWGAVHGCRAAIRHFSERKGPYFGKIINVGSLASDVSIPLQGIYSASKHALRAYTESLRMELEAKGVPVSISLIKPASINTPYSVHALNRMDRRANLPAPIYDPEVVARGILECAERPIRDLRIGGASKLLATLEAVAPHLTELYLEKMMIPAQKRSEPETGREPVNLFHPPRTEGQVRGNHRGHVMKSSLYTRFALHPVAVGMLTLGLGVLFRALAKPLQAEVTDQTRSAKVPPIHPSRKAA